jgi:bifunctional UDP-N-acetylglucosamine pyrophosphorylase/glucosamine-1-phosphate N-acetyltransferase
MGFIVTILAGGEGKRMRSTTPKFLHLFNYKPILTRVLDAAISLTPDKIIVVTGKYHNQIVKVLNKYMDTCGITFVEQAVALGTGNAIQCCLDHYTDDDDVLILNGDMPLVNESVIHSLVECQRSLKPCGTLVTATLENPEGYGRIVKSGELFEIVEEASCSPQEKDIKEVNAGIYLFHADILRKCVPVLSNENSKGEYYFTDVIRHAFDLNYKVNTFTIPENLNYTIRGVNTPEELLDLETLFHTVCFTEPSVTP